jgi:hypothetical protein
MESLIEFIFANIFWVVILVFGLISNFIKKSNGENKKENKPSTIGPVSKPSVFEKRLGRQENPKREVYQKAKQAQITPGDIQNDIKTKAEEKMAELNKQKEYDEKQRDIQVKRAESIKKTYSNDMPQVKMDQQKVIDGLIMSEVLGPPRSKKPYRPGPRRQH